MNQPEISNQNYNSNLAKDDKSNGLNGNSTRIDQSEITFLESVTTTNEINDIKANNQKLDSTQKLFKVPSYKSSSFLAKKSKEIGTSNNVEINQKENLV